MLVYLCFLGDYVKNWLFYGGLTNDMVYRIFTKYPFMFSCVPILGIIINEQSFVFDIKG